MGNNECLFCRIVARELPSNIVYEDNLVLGFRDIKPQAPVHILIVPKQHVARVTDLSNETLPLVSHIHNVAKQLARTENIAASGFRLVINDGPDAGQSVDHIHYHLLGGRKLTWPPG